MKILVTGGAGFIGSHLVAELLKQGHDVVVYDNLDPQVHGNIVTRPDYLNLDVRLVRQDIRDYESLKSCILQEDIEVIFHEAAAVGVGQSMYEIKKYVDVNTLGAANLLDILANNNHQVQKIIVASSMSIYGEGKYFCKTHGDQYPSLRSKEQLQRHEWEMKCPKCNEVMSSLPTDESKPLAPTSIYAITKRDHEEMFISFGIAYGVPAVALRYFNAYGPHQSLTNPYTGAIAIFASRALNAESPLIFEDGKQSRDFVHVSDIVQANLLAMEKKEANYEAFNVGTGRSTSIQDMALALLSSMGKDIDLQILQKFRAGDIRHCYGDIAKIQNKLGFKPQVQIEQGISELLDWLSNQKPSDNLSQAISEMETRKLIR